MIHDNLFNAFSEKIVRGQKHPSPFDDTVCVYLYQMRQVYILSE